MTFNQIEVISKLFYGESFRKWYLKLSYEQRVQKMMAENPERFNECRRLSDEMGVHKDYDKFTEFMGR